MYVTDKEEKKETWRNSITVELRKAKKQDKNRSTSSHNASSVIRGAKVQSNKICIYKTEILPYLSLDKEGKTLHYHLKSNRTRQYSIFTCHNIIKP